MADITAAMVKELRESTGAGMLDCKKALVESNGNMEQAVDWLRKKGLASAAKKSSRIAAEGLVAVTVKGNKGAAVEVNSETDFVAKNEIFQAFVADAVEAALDTNSDVEALKNAKDAVTYCSVGFVEEPLTIVAGALNMNGDAAPKAAATGTADQALALKASKKYRVSGIVLSNTNFTYNGKVQKPKVTVKYGNKALPASNYELTWSKGCLWIFTLHHISGKQIRKREFL